jgi:RNA polymerase subunit RPABC4/transcription elongation factor Spt4
MKGCKARSRDLEPRSTCKKCGRNLEDGEITLCPACKSQRSSGWKKIAQIGAVVITGVLFVLTRGRIRTKL